MTSIDASTTAAARRSAAAAGSATEAAPMLSTRARRSREKLLRAATDLLVAAGPQAVTVDAVADASGVAKSTLYRHWPSRDDLLVDVVRHNIPALPEPDLSDGFAVALRHHLRDVAATLESPEWSRIVPAMMMLRTSMPELAEVVEIDHQSKVRILDTLLAAGVASGEVVADIDLDRAEALTYGPLLFVAITGNPTPLAELADEIAERFISLAATAPEPPDLPGA